MKTKQFIELETHLLPNFPGFVVKGKLMFISPVEHTLRGFHFEASAFAKKNFYINVFFMPLCVPVKHIHFTFGHRIGPNKRWSVDQPELEGTLASEMLKEIPVLVGLKTAKDVAEAVELLTKGNPTSGYVNPHCYEALAYNRIQSGEIPVAANVIDILLEKINPSVAWEKEIALRVRLIKSKLLENPEEAKNQLATWEAESIHNLGLQEFRN